MIYLHANTCDRGENPGCGWCKGCQRSEMVSDRIDARLCEIEGLLRKRGSSRPGDVAERFVRMEIWKETRWD